jgi:hypothetical protein
MISYALIQQKELLIKDGLSGKMNVGVYENENSSEEVLT